MESVAAVNRCFTNPYARARTFDYTSHSLSAAVLVWSKEVGSRGAQRARENALAVRLDNSNEVGATS